MRIVIFTSNARRHRFVANMLAAHAEEALVISEVKPSDSVVAPDADALIAQHFATRFETEEIFFKGHDSFRAPTLPIFRKEAGLPFVVNAVKAFQPDAGFVFGSSILPEALFSLIPRRRFINLHLGLSPYYRGTGTNFWPFVNDELQCVGATILHIDAGVDTGDIVIHARPEFEPEDTVHTVGCKTIMRGMEALVKVLDELAHGRELSRTPQWSVPDGKYYRTKDFDRNALEKYLANLRDGMVARYCENPAALPGLIESF